MMTAGTSTTPSAGSSGVRRSFLKAFFTALFCIFLNIIGSTLSQKLDSVIFLDLVGTAIGTFIYGPIFGIFVGLSTNLLGEFIFGWDFYALFSVIQIACALIWGLTPRLFRGRNCSYPFRDHGDYKFSAYAHKAISISILALLSNFVASLYTGFIVWNFSDQIMCGSAQFSMIPAGSRSICSMSALIFGDGNFTFDYVALKVSLSAFLLRAADHFIAISIAVLIISHNLPRRRYKLEGEFGRVLITLRRGFGIAILITCALLLGARYIDMFVNSGFNTDAILIDLAILVTVAVIIGVIFYIQNWRFVRHYHNGIDAFIMQESEDSTSVERSFEDILKLVVLVAGLAHFWILSSCGKLEFQSGIVPICDAADTGQFQYSGIVGLAFSITVIRYLFLSASRLFQGSLRS